MKKTLRNLARAWGFWKLRFAMQNRIATLDLFLVEARRLTREGNSLLYVTSLINK